MWFWTTLDLAPWRFDFEWSLAVSLAAIKRGCMTYLLKSIQVQYLAVTFIQINVWMNYNKLSDLVLYYVVKFKFPFIHGASCFWLDWQVTVGQWHFTRLALTTILSCMMVNPNCFPTLSDKSLYFEFLNFVVTFPQWFADEYFSRGGGQEGRYHIEGVGFSMGYSRCKRIRLRNYVESFV